MQFWPDLGAEWGLEVEGRGLSMLLGQLGFKDVSVYRLLQGGPVLGALRSLEWREQAGLPDTSTGSLEEQRTLEEAGKECRQGVPCVSDE